MVLDFKNIVSDLKNKKVRLFIRKGFIFAEDINNLYQMDNYLQGTCIDKLISNSMKVKFNIVDTTLSKNIKSWEKEYLYK